MERPDDAAFRLHVDFFAAVRRLLPVAILGTALVGPLLVAEPATAMWYSTALFAAAVFLFRTLNGLPLYPAHTFGIEYRFEDHPFDAGRRRCVRCDGLTADGVHRRYARQFVVLGVPIHTFGWGSNDFCRDCLGAPPDERGAAGGRDSRFRTRNGSPEPSAGTETAAAGTREGDPQAAAEGRPGSPAAGAAEVSGTDEAVAGTARPALGTARRIVPRDETTALEVRRAFDEDGAD